MTSETGILRFGAYIPRNRLQRRSIAPHSRRLALHSGGHGPPSRLQW